MGYVTPDKYSFHRATWDRIELLVLTQPKASFSGRFCSAMVDMKRACSLPIGFKLLIQIPSIEEGLLRL
jgi:hypothetical protein